MVIEMNVFLGMIGHYRHFCGRTFGFGSLHGLVNLERPSFIGLIIV